MTFGLEQLESLGDNRVTLSAFIFSWYRLVTDGWTDRRTALPLPERDKNPTRTKVHTNFDRKICKFSELMFAVYLNVGVDRLIKRLNN